MQPRQKISFFTESSKQPRHRMSIRFSKVTIPQFLPRSLPHPPDPTFPHFSAKNHHLLRDTPYIIHVHAAWRMYNGVADKGKRENTEENIPGPDFLNAGEST